MTDLFTAHNLCKRFGGVHALRNVDVTQRSGETLGMPVRTRLGSVIVTATPVFKSTFLITMS